MTIAVAESPWLSTAPQPPQGGVGEVQYSINSTAIWLYPLRKLPSRGFKGKNSKETGFWKISLSVLKF